MKESVLYSGCFLLNRDRLCEVTWFVDIAAARDGGIVSEQLKRHDRQQRQQEFIRLRYHDDMVDVLLKLRIAFCRDADDDSVTCLDFLDIRQRLLVDALLRRQSDDRHAFDDADMTDVRALIDHDPRLCLGRHNDNVETLEFSIDDTGLFATIQINPDDTDALSLRARVLRGDVDQASFGFEESSVEYTDLPDGRVRRTIRKISKLWEVSVCTFPAYEQTYVSARSASGDALRRSVLEHRKTKLKRRLKHHGKK